MSYVCVDAVEVAVQRVQRRAIDEIRTVDPDVVRRRFPSSLAALSDAISRLRRVDLFDNSEEALRWIARFENGIAAETAEHLPRWAVDTLPQIA